MGETVYSTSNAEYGITAYIVTGSHGYHVILRDDDAELDLEGITCYPDIERAIAYADKLVA